MWKYKFNGFVPGLPARDLTDEEVNGMSKERQAIIKHSGLYEYQKEKPVKSEKVQESEK